MSSSASSTDKRSNILRVATLLFSRYGFKKTSIDQIAKEAGIAKPTLYAYFESKDALFGAVCQFVGEYMLAEAATAAAAPDSLEARVSGVLSAKFTRTFELVDSSPHAQELINVQQRAAQQSIAEADARFTALLTGLLDSAGQTGELDLDALGLDAPSLASRLMQLGHGASFRVRSAEQHRANLAELVSLMLRAGLTKQPRRTRKA